MQSTDSFVDEIYSLIYTKSVESILSLVPRHKGLRIALIVETSNAKAPRQCKYTIRPLGNKTAEPSEANTAV